MPSEDSAVHALLMSAGYFPVNDNPDFVVYTGGADVDPEIYGEIQAARTFTNPVRDYNDMAAFIRYRDLPKIGICRGFQFLGACNGNKLTQHIDNHTRKHTVVWADGEEYIPKLVVSSTHHQCVQAGKTEVPIAVADDGTLEAANFPDINAFGVQFHPECAECSDKAVELFLKHLTRLLGED